MKVKPGSKPVPRPVPKDRTVTMSLAARIGRIAEKAST